MRIGIACHHTYGGSGTVATELGMSLARRGHRVHFIGFAQPYRLQFDPNIYFHQVDTMQYPLFEHTPVTLSLAAKMGETIRTENLELLHVHYAIPFAAAAYLAMKIVDRPGVRLITTLHGTDITLVGQDPSFYSITKFSIEQSDSVTTVSEWLRGETITRFGITQPIEVISNSVDTSRFKRAEASSCSRSRYAPNGEAIVMHISNFRPVKRIPDVIRIFAKIRERMPAKLLMIGDGPLRMPAQELAVELGVMKDVWFLGKQERIEAFLSLADLFLFPSEYESFGLAALEAMACEVPVVASRAGGIPEVIVDGENGYLCGVGDTDAMAAKSVDILTNPDLAKRMAAANVERVNEHFRAEVITEAYERLYENTLASPTHRA